jgi:hypothetical protein
MKYLLILLTIFGFLFQPKLKLIDAQSYSWAGGRQESGKGTNYTFKVVAGKSSDILKIDQLWIGDLYFEVKPQRQLENLSITNEFEKNDTLIIQVNHRLLPDESNELKPAFEYEQIDPPYQYEGKALIGYKKRGKQKYLEVKEIQNQAPKLYQ